VTIVVGDGKSKMVEVIYTKCNHDNNPEKRKKKNEIDVYALLIVNLINLPLINQVL
jgi:hypothetical protein